MTVRLARLLAILFTERAKRGKLPFSRFSRVAKPRPCAKVRRIVPTHAMAARVPPGTTTLTSAVHPEPNPENLLSYTRNFVLDADMLFEESVVGTAALANPTKCRKWRETRFIHFVSTEATFLPPLTFEASGHPC